MLCCAVQELARLTAAFQPAEQLGPLLAPHLEDLQDKVRDLFLSFLLSCFPSSVCMFFCFLCFLSFFFPSSYFTFCMLLCRAVL